MSLEFPFEYAEVEGLGRLFYPVIVCQLRTTRGWHDFEFLVDTGADLTTLPAPILPILGFEKSKLRTGYTFGVGDIRVKTWEFSLPVKMGEVEFSIRASAVETRGEVTPLLLGRKDIFEERFSLTLDSQKKTTILKLNERV